MKKLYSLIKACMTSDMNIFKIKRKDNNKSNIKLIIFISLCFMFAIWSYANLLFEQMAPFHLQVIVISLFVFMTSIITVVEGIYKSSSLLFNCKDDQLLLSLPIERRTVLFIRIFKFYVFELAFNSLFLIPLIIAYIRWAEYLDWTYFLTSFVMIFLLPIIPIVISCIIGSFTASISSRFKYKNTVQIVLTMLMFVAIYYVAFNLDGIFDYIVKNATSVNDLITKIYYPAGLYASLVTKFNIMDLIIFILINIAIFIVSIYVLSKFYFKINSRLKKVTTSKKTKLRNLNIKSKSIYYSLIKKELNTFFKTPVFIVNAGLGLVIYIIIALTSSFKFDEIMPIITDSKTINIPIDLIINNLSLLILVLIVLTSFMTSITNSVISLEGRNINILKSLPLKTKTILMSKVYTGLLITTPVILIGDIILFIKFKISIIECILLAILSILMPLVSHFIGIIINLKYPKLDAENSTEIIKQSTSSFISVMIGMLLFVITTGIIFSAFGKYSSILILIIIIIIYLIVDIILYLYLINNGTKQFEKLSI